MSSQLRRDSLLAKIRHAIGEPYDWVDENEVDGKDPSLVYLQSRAVERALIEEGVLGEVGA